MHLRDVVWNTESALDRTLCLSEQAVQIDVKLIMPLKGSRKKFYQYTAIDDCTRLRILRIYDRNNQKTAIQFAEKRARQDSNLQPSDP
jgi:hypothetical protein